MSSKNLIPISALSVHYEIEMSFFRYLNEMELIKIHVFEDIQYIEANSLYEVEKIIRMHHELDLNLEGIDVALNLLQKIEDLQNELKAVKNRLRLYES
jgi:chaperone modulatory protein CbpM